MNTVTVGATVSPETLAKIAAARTAKTVVPKADAKPVKLASEVPQPKLAHGNTGPHSREAVRLNAKAAAQHDAPAAPLVKAPLAKVVKGKAAAPKAPAKAATVKVVKVAAAPKTQDVKKITVGVKLADTKVRATSERYARLAFVYGCKTTADVYSDKAKVSVRPDNVAWMVKQGFIKLV